MKEFKNPAILEMSDLAIEPVYALSGSTNTVNDSNKKWASSGDDDGCVKTEWRAHNSGSHSEIKVKICPGKSGDNIRMDFQITDFKLNSIEPGDGCLTISNMGEKNFTLCRNGRHYNPGDDIQFVMQLTCKKPGGGVGAVGVSGQQTPCNVYCVGKQFS